MLIESPVDEPSVPAGIRLERIREEMHVQHADGVSVSTALTILSGEGAGVYWVGTAAHARRSGLGELCTRLATNAGFASGASVVTLQASPYGEALYRRLGYKTYDRLLRFRHPAPGQEH
jgi:ribosomal protein S18 acetylase RimI-like enzyme